jgi:chromosome partitioning protein
MLRLVVSNQRGGVAKTTTSIAAARYFADQGCRVLLVDTDPQGSIASVLRLKPGDRNLFQFLIKGRALRDCIVECRPGLHVLCGNRETMQAEALLMTETAREFTFKTLFSPTEHDYDVVLIDVAPSINLLQTCAMVYARQLLIPVAMDMLSLQGAAASIETATMLTSQIRKLLGFDFSIIPVALLPVMVDKRYQITDNVLEGVRDIGARFHVPVLPGIRTDAIVKKAEKAGQFLEDFDPTGKALQDYKVSLQALKELVGDQLNGAQAELTSTQTA